MRKCFVKKIEKMRLGSSDACGQQEAHLCLSAALASLSAGTRLPAWAIERIAVQPRLYIGPDLGLGEGVELALPEGAARHVQVLRLQPGHALRLFDGSGGEWAAKVTEMGRREVRVVIGVFSAGSRELPAAVTLAMGMPTNERMDTVVEKATELGVSAIQPLMCERSVLRLDGERAAKKVAHWQAVAVAAAEQSGRTRVPMVHPVVTLRTWLALQAQESARCGHGDSGVSRGMLSLHEAQWVGDWLASRQQVHEQAKHYPAWAFLSGPEGGLSEAEESLARDHGWTPVSLGPRVLRADTAPMTVMGLVALQYPPR